LSIDFPVFQQAAGARKGVLSGQDGLFRLSRPVPGKTSGQIAHSGRYLPGCSLSPRPRDRAPPGRAAARLLSPPLLAGFQTIDKPPENLYNGFENVYRVSLTIIFSLNQKNL
jgi:hypothetical protein